MFSWQYNEKMMKDWIYNHSKDYGRFCCELMLDYPLLYSEYLKGFQDELEKRFGEGAGTRRDDPPPPNEDGLSRR